MHTRYKNINQSGDTIVEVLISLAVISSVLVGAFIVSQKSTQAVQSSQEHAEMTQILQGQIELVRANALTQSNDSAGVFGSGSTYFCVNSAQAIVTMPSLGSPDGSGYETGCKDIQGRYNVAVTYNSTSKVFTFIGTWDRIGGGSNQEQMSYRIYPGA